VTDNTWVHRAALRIGTVSLAAALALPLGLAATPGRAQEALWVGTWSASPQPVWAPDFFAPVSIPRSVRDQTIRQVARLSQGGERFQIEFSNRYGDEAMTIGRAAIAKAGKDGRIEPGTSRPLTFSGNSGVTIPAGAPVLSDPVDFTADDLTEVAVTIYLPAVTPLTTWHNDGRQTAYISANGDFTDAESFEAAATTNARLFLSGIDVAMDENGRAIVLFGDSITDGDSSTPNENRRWPDRLAERIVAAGSDVGVLNEGISGARVLRDRMGVNALARFEDDVLSHPAADTVVLMMGINDIGWPDSPLVPAGEPAPSADDIIAGYKQLIARAHMNGLTIIGATLTPFENTFAGGPLASYYNEEKEAKREAVNAFIRSGAFDGVIDFDELVRDPQNPRHIKAEFDSGDHLHPNDAGYKAMADAIDLGMLGID
jgi:lysophospholipase L1-like esterase